MKRSNNRQTETSITSGSLYHSRNDGFTGVRPTSGSTGSRHSSKYGSRASVPILHEHDLVAFFVVQQLLDFRTHGQNPESTRSHPFFLAHDRVRRRIVFRLADGGVQQPLHVEAGTRIGDAIEQHPLCLEESD